MLTLTSFRSLSRSSTILSSTGETAWHGPHHSAQKSTMTGLSLWRTSCAKVDSFTAVLIAILPFLCRPTLKRRAGSRCSPYLESKDGAGLCTAAAGSRPSSTRGGDSAVVGGRTRLPAVAGAKPRRAEVPVHGRADHG